VDIQLERENLSYDKTNLCLSSYVGIKKSEENFKTHFKTRKEEILNNVVGQSNK
jgi:hypothetical protein